MEHFDNLSYPPYEFIFFLSPSKLRLELQDSSSNKNFQISFLDTQIIGLTNNLCSSLKEFCELLKNAVTCVNEQMKLTIQEQGLIKYECVIDFPFLRSFSFSFQMEEIEFDELKKIELLIRKANKKIEMLEARLENVPNQVFHNNCSFSLRKNSGYFQFYNKMKSLKRNKHEDGVSKTVWATDYLDLKEGKAYFSIKITCKNIKFDVCHAAIGVGFESSLGNSCFDKGCYAITNGKVYFNTNFQIVNDFLFVGDVIIVFVSLEKGSVIWERGGERIAEIPIEERFKKEKVYAIVSLTHLDESITFI